jgi:CheY-like chemotaxis protein
MSKLDDMAKTVLIVDDHEHLRHILASILRVSGYEILEAGTGTQAIEKAVSGKPNLILLDLDLPDITGIDAARVIKKNPTTANIPIVACSASSGWEWREEALRAGMAEYLQKPIQSAEIKSIIDKFILPEK